MKKPPSCCNIANAKEKSKRNIKDRDNTTAGELQSNDLSEDECLDVIAKNYRSYNPQRLQLVSDKKEGKFIFYLRRLTAEEKAEQNGKGWQFEHAFECQDAKALVRHMYSKGFTLTRQFMTTFTTYLKSELNTFLASGTDNRRLAAMANAVNQAIAAGESSFDFDAATTQQVENEAISSAFGLLEFGKSGAAGGKKAFQYFAAANDGAKEAAIKALALLKLWKVPRRKMQRWRISRKQNFPPRGQAQPTNTIPPKVCIFYTGDFGKVLSLAP